MRSGRTLAKALTPPGLILALLFLCTSFAAAGQNQITIGLVPEMNVFAQVQRFQPLADYLNHETGIAVKLSILNRYSSVIDELRKQNIDAAFLGSFTAALAVSQLSFTPIARPVNLDKTSTYHGIIFTRKNSGITTAEDMRGKTMAFVDRSTTAGYIFPLAWLKKNGVSHYQEFFKESFFAGSHDAAIDAVMKNKADVGAVKNTIFDYYLERFPAAKKELLVIARSQPVPSNGLCVTTNVDKETIAKLQTALISLNKTVPGKEVLQKLRAIKFIETRADDYAPVFELLAEAGITLDLFHEKDTAEKQK